MALEPPGSFFNCSVSVKWSCVQCGWKSVPNFSFAVEAMLMFVLKNC